MEPDTQGVLKKEEVQAEKKFSDRKTWLTQGFTWGVDGNANNDNNLTKPKVGKTLIYGSYLLDCPCMEDLDTGHKHPFCRNPECRTSWSVSATVCYLWRQHSRKNCNRLSPHLLPRGGMLDMRLPLKVQISINKLQIKCDSRCFFFTFSRFSFKFWVHCSSEGMNKSSCQQALGPNPNDHQESNHYWVGSNISHCSLNLDPKQLPMA